MLIGLNGVAGAGKDTVAQYLVEYYGFKRYAFADALRDIALAINPIVWQRQSENVTEIPETVRLSDLIAIKGWDRAKRENPEVRRLLQVIGTEAGRQLVGMNVWVDIVRDKWYADGKPDAVITDFRFENEHRFIEQEDGVTVKLHRVHNPDAIPATHASEQYSPDCDYTLVHGGDNLSELYQLVDGLMHSFSHPESIKWDYAGND